VFMAFGILYVLSAFGCNDLDKYDPVSCEKRTAAARAARHERMEERAWLAKQQKPHFH